MSPERSGGARSAVILVVASLAAGLLAALVPAGPTWASPAHHRLARARVCLRADGYRAPLSDCPAAEPTRDRIPATGRPSAGSPPGGDTGGLIARSRDGGGIAGIVRNTARKVLGGVCVIAEGANRRRAETATGKNGHFTVSGLPPGRYKVEFTIGCGTKGNYAFQWWRGAALADQARKIRVVADRVTTGIDPVLLPGGTVVGTVRARRRGGKLLSQICVRALDDDLRGDAAAVTDMNGRYRLIGLASDVYALQFDATCFGSKPAFYVPQDIQLTINARQRHEVYNDVMLIGAGVFGVVTDTSGHPVHGVCVLISDNKGDENGMPTRFDGRYSVVLGNPGSYTVQFNGGCGNTVSVAEQFYKGTPAMSTASLLKLKKGKVASNIDATMRPGGTIAGVVTNLSGHRLRRICVGVVPPANSIFISPNYAATTFTSPRGRYVMRDLVPGPYQVNFNCSGSRWSSPWFNSQQDSTTASFVSVDPGVTTRINGKVTESGAITGKVTNIGGRPLFGICALLANPNTRLLVNLESPESVVTGLDGRYRFAGLTPGRYTLQFSDCNDSVRYETLWYPNRATAARATSILVRPGQTVKRVDAVLVGGGRISGTVTGPSDKPLANYCVQAFDRAALASQSASTDRRGRYTVAGLGTGEYSLYFYACDTGGPNIGEASWPGLVRTRLKHATTGINIRLKQGGSVSGTVFGGPGRSVRQAGICVDAVPRDPHGSQPFAATGARGRYLLTDLSPGRYQIYLSDPFCNLSAAGQGQNLFAPQWYNDQLTQATANTVTVAAGRTDAGIGATLRQFGSISGTVNDAARRGVGGECVTAVPFRPLPDPFAGPFLATEIAITARTGRYALLGLLPGRYKIEFSVGCGDTGFGTQWWRDASSAKSATVVDVRFGPIGGVNATLRSLRR